MQEGGVGGMQEGGGGGTCGLRGPRVEAVGFGQSCCLLLDVVLQTEGSDVNTEGRAKPLRKVRATFSSSRSSLEGANMLLAIAWCVIGSSPSTFDKPPMRPISARGIRPNP